MPKINTLREALFWSYANTAMAHFAITNGLTSYNRACFMIRSRLNKGLLTGKMKISSLYDDEKARLNTRHECVYCGKATKLSLDHLIPKESGGWDSADNLVYACRYCNSSKSDRDLLVWYSTRNEFPPIYILRRYLKLLVRHCAEKDIMEIEFENYVEADNISFRIDMIPLVFPQPEHLRL